MRVSLRIHGMDCADEVVALKQALVPVVGNEERLAFDLLNGKLTVTDSSVPVERLVETVAGTGMRAEPWQEAAERGSGATGEGRARAAFTGASGLAALAGFLVHSVTAGGVGPALGSEGLGSAAAVPLPARAAYALAIACGGRYVLPRAWAAVRTLRADMNVLMTIAVVGAVALGEWFEGAVVSFLFAVSLALESWSVAHARQAVRALMDLAPTTVRLLAEGAERLVPPERVAVGDRFMVLGGERFPLDGTVVRGTSEVNQAPITGESVPVAKAPGDPVFAGTVNGTGALEVECTKRVGETTLAHIIQLVGEAHSRRASSEQWVEKFARYYTPAVVAIALAVLLVPPLLFGAAWDAWVYRALVLLVIGCPCALVISTPVSIVAGLAAAARNGVLVKGGLFLEVPARLDAIAMDKTGTLTRGAPTVVEVVPIGGHDEGELLAAVAAIEARSEHPIARAIVAFARQRGVSFTPADDVIVVPGRGVTATWQGKAYWLGSHRYLEERGQETPEVHDRLVALAGAGRTVVLVGNESHVCGIVALADEVRPEARAAVDALRAAGVRHVIMLTGDNRGTAEVVGKATGMDEVRAELLPEDKVAAIEALVARYGRVAMVGDGVNDAPALARATLGIAMGAAGSDAAIETADVALMSDDLSKLAWLVRHARRTLSVVRQNIGFSIAVKAIFVVLTFAGVAHLWAAIAADMGASLLVILNGLRLLRPSSDA